MAELERFKQEISLVELASWYGYELVKTESSHASIAMKHPDGDKIIVTTEADGHDVFFSVHGDHSGSVIDLVMFRENVNLGGARKVLRRCLMPGYLSSRSVIHYRPELASHDVGLYGKWQKMRAYSGGYLEYRGLSVETIALFSKRIHLDERCNVAFRHDSLCDLSGWELKNKGFTGFASGGRKGLFGCKIGTPGETPVIVLAESAIDVMSYYQMRPLPGYYLSFGGGLSCEQIPLLKWVTNRYPVAQVLIATDADEQGEKYAAQIWQVRADAVRDRPGRGKDWNDVLNNRDQRLEV
jgi:hypothetical protein